MTCDMWFGTQDYAGWIQTPQRGANVSSSAWGENGTLIDGSGYAMNSRNSHKRYVFSWRSTSTRQEAQLIKSYFDGSFGTGKIYFVDPLTYTTNILPARWASPSITCDFEGPSLVPGVNPVRVLASNPESLRLPVSSASYDMSAVSPLPVTREVRATNHFTNPNLVGDGTWAEVRRNMCTDPALTTTVGKALTRVSATASGGVLTATVGEVGFFPRVAVVPPAGSGGLPVTAGETIAVSAKREAGDIAIRIVYYSSSNSVVATVDPSVFVSVGVASSITTVPAEAVKAFIEVSTASNQAVGYQFAFSEVLIEKSSITGNYFAGSTPDFSVDPDMRTRWLGAENASESVMEIERVRGLTTSNSIAGVSTQDGKAAVRMIPLGTQSSGTPLAHFPIPADARASGTLMGTLHIRNELTGTFPASTRRVGVANPFQWSGPSPTTSGTYAHRLNYADLTSTYLAYIYAGARRGGGDVWWTDIGLFEGDYSGGVFSGDTGIVTLNGQNLTTAWQGEPNNSPSEAFLAIPTGSTSVVRDQALFIPIPDGHQLNLGAFYTASGNSGVWAVPATRGGTPGNSVSPLTRLTGSESDLLPDVFTKAPGEIGVYLWFGNLASSLGASLRVTAIQARLSRIGSAPGGGRMWVGGQGNEGTRFAGPPTYINQTGRDGGQIEFAATFVESVI